MTNQKGIEGGLELSTKDGGHAENVLVVSFQLQKPHVTSFFQAFKLLHFSGIQAISFKLLKFKSAFIRVKLFSRSLRELSALIKAGRGVLQFERTADVYQTERETRQKTPSLAQ